jgi:thiosulfate/3-mercaptopyruvate sulfurtransferase
MRKARLLSPTWAVAILVTSVATPGMWPRSQEDAPDLIVSLDWLHAHLEDPSVVIVATGGDRSGFETQHIPGSRYIDHDDTLSEGHRRLDPDEFTRRMAKVGATDSTRIVVYGDEPMTVGWLLMSLAAAGHADHTVLLDGNVEAWRAAGYPVATGAAPPAADGRFTADPAPDVEVDGEWVRHHLNDPGVRLLDVRTEHEWKAGQIPGAARIRWEDLYADLRTGRLKDRASLRRVLGDAGVTDGQMVVTYCAVGMRASLMYFAARALGFPARVYVGSWSDWRAHGYPIERQPAA